MRIFSDTPPPQTADFTFLFGQTSDNQESVLSQAEQALERKLTSKVGFLHAGALSGYPGFDVWHQLLLERNVKPEQIEGVPFGNTDLIHTRIEAEAMILHARKQGYESIYILAAPFHQLRAFMTAVTVALEYYPSARLYSLPGMPLPWQQTVAHSQGKVLGTRSELVVGEWERIETYTEKGDLATVSQVINYLNQRDASGSVG